jgi:hypothetical protein
VLILFAKIRVQGFKQKESRWSLVYSFTRGVAMAYEDIYKGLTEEEKQRMIKDDIPKFRVIGDANLSEEELRQAEQDLDKIIKRLRKRAKNKNDRNKNT